MLVNTDQNHLKTLDAFHVIHTFQNSRRLGWVTKRNETNGMSQNQYRNDVILTNYDIYH